MFEQINENTYIKESLLSVNVVINIDIENINELFYKKKICISRQLKKWVYLLL